MKRSSLFILFALMFCGCSDDSSSDWDYGMDPSNDCLSCNDFDQSSRPSGPPGTRDDNHADDSNDASSNTDRGSNANTSSTVERNDSNNNSNLNNDSSLSSNNSADSSALSNKIANGLACSSNDQCESGNCYEGRVCRKQGWGGSKQYQESHSGTIANGLACSSDDECESGNCYEGRVCRKQGWGGSTGSSSNTSSDSSSQTSNSSGSSSTGSSSTGSSSSGSNASSVKLIDGSNCDFNSDCQSGLCVSETCVSASGYKSLSGNKTGLGNNSNGSACSDDLDCESGLCLNGVCSGDCQIYGCNQGYYVCREDKCIPAETHSNECTEHSDCAAGMYCCNGFCKAGACEPGISCESSSTCVNYCESTNWGKICGCNVDTECGSDYYCNKDTNTWFCEHKLPVGGNCYNSDSRCMLDACYQGKCIVPRESGQACNSNGDCAGDLICYSGTCRAK